MKFKKLIVLIICIIFHSHLILGDDIINIYDKRISYFSEGRQYSDLIKELIIFSNLEYEIEGGYDLNVLKGRSIKFYYPKVRLSMLIKIILNDAGYVSYIKNKKLYIYKKT